MSKPKVKHLVAMQKLLVKIRKYSDVGLRFRRVGTPEPWILALPDSSLAGEEDGATQQGYIIGVTPKLQHPRDLLRSWAPHVFNILAWRSFRCKRAVTNTLGAETLSAFEAYDVASWVAMLLGEILFGLPLVPGIAMRHMIVVLSDCASLVDHVMGHRNLTREKRLASYISVLRRALTARSLETIEHITTDLQAADCLTKSMTVEGLVKILEMAEICLYVEKKRGHHLVEKPVMRDEQVLLVALFGMDEFRSERGDVEDLA